MSDERILTDATCDQAEREFLAQFRFASVDEAFACQNCDRIVLALIHSLREARAVILDLIHPDDAAEIKSRLLQNGEDSVYVCYGRASTNRILRALGEST